MAFHPQPLFFLVLGLVAGTLAPVFEVSAFLYAGLALAAFVAIAAVVRPGQVSIAALVVASAAPGALLGAVERSNFDRHALPRSVSAAAGPVILLGRVESDPRVIDDQIRFDLMASSVVAGGTDYEYRGRVRVYARGSSDGARSAAERFDVGDEVRIWADLKRPDPPRTPGGFDQLQWAMRERVHAIASCKNDRLISVTADRASPRSPLARARNRLKHSWRHVADPMNRAVTASMVLGDEGALDRDTREAFRSAGLLHLLVVSGAQIGALVLGLRRLMPRGLRISWPGCVLECAVLIGYCLLAGAEDSIVRATVMATAFAIAVRVDLSRGGANFLAASALILLSLRPLDAVDPGAQMSFAATLALVWFASPVARGLTRRRMPEFLADVLAATLVATMAVAPLTLTHFHRLSVISLPANLLAAPLAVALLYGSLATTWLDVFLPPAAWIGGLLCNVTAEALRFVAGHAATMDPDWRGPSPPLVLMLSLASLIFGRGHRRFVVPVAGLVAALTLSGLPRGDGRLHLWFLDVGQGDALLIESPTGRVAAIDAGPAFEGFDAGERVVAPAAWALGYRRLDFLAITHRHADHDGGAPFLGRHFRPATLYVNGTSAAMDSFAPTVVDRGDAWKVDGVSYRVLGPDPASARDGRDENARSLVIEVRYQETSFLLMGDASQAAERSLELWSRGYDGVKVGHHGAGNSSSERLVRETHPRLAVVSVGARNRFSHPSPAVVERWARSGALVWRTDQDRTLHVISDGRRLTW